MIDKTLLFLKEQLNTYLSQQANLSSAETASEALVQFLDGAKMDPLTFQLGAVSVLLINLEQENTLRAPDLYRRTADTGEAYAIQPEIRLHLYVLFVAHFSHYEDALAKLSLIIQHFQKHRLFQGENEPKLAEAGIEQLIVELTTLPFAEQNEVWNALRTTYHPSVLYKVKMLVFQDDKPVEPPAIKTRVLTIGGSTRAYDEQGNRTTVPPEQLNFSR